MSAWLTSALTPDGAIGQGIAEMTANVAAIAPVALGVIVAVIVAKTGISLVKSFMSKGK